MKGGMTFNTLLLMFCILLSLRAFGYQSGIDYIATFDFTNDAVFNTMLLTIGGAFIASVGAAVVSRVAGGSYSVVYIIPAVVLGVMAVTLITPIGFLMDTSIPEILRIMLMGYLYMSIFVAAYSFVRGSDI